MSILMSLVGMVALIAIAVAMSNNRKAINLRVVGGAFAIQLSLAAFILYVPAGRKVLEWMSNGVGNVLNYGNEGINFLFGGLVSGKMFEVFGGGGFVFAFRVLPAIVFFSSLIAVLYYLGVMQFFVKVIGGGISKLLGTSKAVSMSAAANIFVGQTEAPLVVKPHVEKMSQSDLFAVMVGGLASIAGSVLAAFAGMGIPLPYLIAACFMAAPGGLLFAKLIMPDAPEDKKEDVTSFEIAEADEKPSNIFDAAASGAFTGMQMAANIGAMLIAFIGLIALVNGILGGLGSYVGLADLSLSKIFGVILSPLAWLIGASWSEAQVVGSLIGQKVVVNEFFAFAEYTSGLKDGSIVLSEKTQAIVAFALCGFANLSSIAILIGGLGVIAPSRRSDIARFGFKAMVAGTLSNLMAATIAGLFVGLSGAAALGLA